MNERSFAAQLAADLGPDDLKLVLSVFESDVARLTRQLSETAQAGDAPSFRRAAHGLAGAAGAVGAQTLEQACRAAMSQTDAPADALLAANALIKTMADASIAELEAFVRDLDAGG